MLPASCWLLGIIFNPEEGGTVFILFFGELVSGYTLSPLKR
jgi:hypothetical protein